MMQLHLCVVSKEWAKEKSPSPTRRMRSVEENGMVGGNGFGPFELLVAFDGFVRGGFLLDCFAYGFEICLDDLAFFALPIA